MLKIDVHLDKLFEHLKKISPVVVSIGIVSSFILFMPEDMLQRLHLANIPENWMLCISVLFLFCVFLTLIIVLQILISSGSKRLKRCRTIRSFKKMFKSLDNKQKEYIRQLLLNDHKQIRLDMNDGNALYLTQIGYIYQPGQITDIDPFTKEMIVGFNAQPWLITAFNDNPDFFLKD